MVRSISYAKVLCLSSLILTAGVSATGCLTSSGDDDSRGTGGAGGTGGTGGAGMTSGAGGMAAAAGASSSQCDTSAPEQACTHSAAPMSGKVIDFTSYAGDGTWGVSAKGDLTGGTSAYPPDTNTLILAATGGSLHITGTVPMGGYFGEVFWFGPCVDASAFGGTSFSASGSLGAATMLVQMQSAEDYPIDPGNKKGACHFTDCDTKFTSCQAPTATVTVASDATVIDLPWSSFTAGAPVDGLSPSGLTGLLGIQIQFNCPAAADCPIDLTLGTISFTPPT
jgi:hypothetical protein